MQVDIRTTRPVPTQLGEMLQKAAPEQAARRNQAMCGKRRLIVSELAAAFEG